MGLSLKQRYLFHKKRMVNLEVDKKDRFFSVGYVSGSNLFSRGSGFTPEEQKSVIKEKARNVKEMSKYKHLNPNELEELSRAKGLMSYASDLSKDKQKRGLSLFDKEIKRKR